MTYLIQRLRGVLIAFVVLALSAGLAFGAQPDAAASGLANAAAHAGKIVPVQAGDEETSEDEDTDEDADEDADQDAPEQESAEDSAEAGENCTDPTALTPEELEAMRHGSIVCWAAQQTEWPEWFANHGSFVKCWAHQGKADATSCTEDPTAGQPAAAGASNEHGHGKGKGHNK